MRQFIGFITVLLAILVSSLIPWSSGDERFSITPSYFFYPGRFTHEIARVICRGLGGHIAIMKSEAEKDQAASALPEDGWIGLRRNLSCPSEWIWDDSSCMGFSQWDYGQPDNRNGKENCVMMWVGSKKWHDYECATEVGVLCQSF